MTGNLGDLSFKIARDMGSHDTLITPEQGTKVT